MPYSNEEMGHLLASLDLGSSVAEHDNLLQRSRVETSTFTDLLADRVDLVPGTKGSGKTSLFRIFVEFLAVPLLSSRKIVVAHGVDAPGDPVFLAFSDVFEALTEDEFVDFWCIYLVSLAREQFVRDERFSEVLTEASAEVREFRDACQKAGLPEIRAKRSLRGILEWALHTLKTWRPKLKYKLPDDVGEIEMDLFGKAESPPRAEPQVGERERPVYLREITEALEKILVKCNFSLWLMVDRLDEIFPRRTTVEKTALRGLLRAMRYFARPQIRVKVFLRDDMLDHVVSGAEGFTALTHLTARKSDTLRWTRDQLVTMLVNRIFANAAVAEFFDINAERLAANAEYREQAFYRVFPKTVFQPTKQSNTIDWIYNRCADGRGVATPRDVLELVIRARQRQQDICLGSPGGESDQLISRAAIRYGFEEMSRTKRTTYLQAEFPHLWPKMELFQGGKSQYEAKALQEKFGKDWERDVDDLVSIGFLERRTSQGREVFVVPFLYRAGMDIKRGSA